MVMRVRPAVSIDYWFYSAEALPSNCKHVEIGSSVTLLAFVLVQSRLGASHIEPVYAIFEVL